MVDLFWENMLVFAALGDQYVKSEVYKPNCLLVKSLKKMTETTETTRLRNDCFHQIFRPEIPLAFRKFRWNPKGIRDSADLFIKNFFLWWSPHFFVFVSPNKNPPKKAHALLMTPTLSLFPKTSPGETWTQLLVIS